MSGVDEGATAFGEVADKFVESYRMGRDPSIEDYANRYPQLADQIRELLPTLVMMEKVKSPKNEEAELNGGDSSMVGQKLGDYQILREIGRGGMGVVYEAEQISLGRHVALKVMPNHEPFKANLQVRFEREAKAAARLHHTNIVPVFGVGEENGLSYYVMQFINGLGLDEIFDQLKIVRNKTEADSKDTSVQREPHPQSEVEQAAHSLLTSDNNLAAHTGDAEQDSLTSRRPQAVGPELTGGLLSEQSELGKSNASSIHMPSSPHDSSSKADPYWRNIARIGMQVSDALQYAHEQGVTHRDIKPSNLLLDVRNTVWVTDFGLAKADDEANITRSGDILGTIRYMPPEAFEGQADARGDLYSLGITLYELATLRPAFSAVGRRELIKRVASGHPEPLRRLAGNIPRDLATIIEKSIERDLGSRYQSAGELYDDLRRFLNDEPIRARRTSLLERIGRWTRHNRALAASLAGVIALLLMVVIGSVTAAFYFFEQEAEQRRLFLQAKSLASRNDKLLGNLKGALDQSLASGKLADLRNQALRQSRLTRRNLYSANMLNALESIEGHRGYARTQVILDAWRPGPNDEDLRGWEWYYIQSVCNQQLFTLAGHEDRVLGVSLSPTANRLASASRDGTLIIWDLDRQTSITRLTSPVGALRCVAWDPQDRYVAVGGERGMVVWDVSTWEIVHQSPANRRIYGLQWRPDGQRLARCGVIRDGESEVVLIDPQTFETVTEIPAPVRALFALQPSWSGDGKRLALPSQRSTSLWDAVAEKLTLDVLSEDNGTQSAVFHPTNPDLLLQSGRSGMGILWDLRTKKVATRLQGHTHAISQAAWRPGSDQIATASWDGSVRLWNGKSGKLLTTVHGHERHVFALAWTPDGDRLVSAGNDHLIKCWRPEHPGHIRRFDCGPGLIDCQLNSDSSILSAAYTPGDLRIYDFADGGLKTVFENGPNQIWTTKLSTDSKRLVSAGAREIGPRGLVRIWNVDTGKQISEYDSPEVVRSLDWIEDKGLVILGLSHGGIQVLDEQLRPARPVIRTGLRSIDVLQLGPDDERLAFGGRGGMGLLHIASGKIKFWPGVTVAVEDLEWSRSGSKIAASTFEQHITVWDVETNSIAREFPNHFEPIYAIKWSPNDRRLLSVDARGTLVLWDANTGQPTLKKRTGFGRVRIALWSADGKIIVTNDSKSIVVLDASRGFQVESATKN